MGYSSVELYGEDAFFGASNLTITATDAPNLSSVTNMSFLELVGDGVSLLYDFDV